MLSQTYIKVVGKQQIVHTITQNNGPGNTCSYNSLTAALTHIKGGLEIECDMFHNNNYINTYCTLSTSHPDLVCFLFMPALYFTLELFIYLYIICLHCVLALLERGGSNYSSQKTMSF